MKVEAWIHFEEPGEKEQLKQIIEANPNQVLAIAAIQEAFDVNLADAYTIFEMYNKRIKK